MWLYQLLPMVLHEDVRILEVDMEVRGNGDIGVNEDASIVAELHILVIAFSGYVSCNTISRIQHRLNFHLILCDDVDRIDIITIQPRFHL